MAFSVLVVCTGNICRSPAAELLLRTRLREAGVPDIAVSSAGTSGLSGHRMDLPSAMAVRELGVDPDQHVARRLTPLMIVSADLVLTADSTHRSSVVQAEPLMFRRTFTLREFARLGARLPPLAARPTSQQLRDRVAEVAGQRGQVEPGPAGSDEIGDPMGAGLGVARTTVATIDSSVTGVVIALGLLVGRATRLGKPGPGELDAQQPR